MTISRRGVLALVGLPLLASCGEPVDFTPEEHRSSAPPASAVPSEVVVEPTFFARSTTGRHVALADATPSGIVFSTPHLDGRIGEIYVGDTLPYDVAQQIDQTAPLRAPDGHRFVAFTAQAGRPVFEEDAEHPVSAAFNQAGTPVPLRNLFGGLSRGAYTVSWEFVVGCVPVDDTAMLEVTDEGKTIRVDLVQGAPANDEAWISNERFRNRSTVSFDPPNGIYERVFGAQPEGHERQLGGFRLGLAPADALLLPWNPEHHWAPPGSLWLTIPMNAQVEFAETPATIELSLPNSFRYEAASGELGEMQEPHVVSTEDIRRARADIRPTFRVPAGDESGRLTFAASGQIRVDFQEIPGVVGEFVGEATPVQFNVAFPDAPDRFNA